MYLISHDGNYPSLQLITCSYFVVTEISDLLFSGITTCAGEVRTDGFPLMMDTIQGIPIQAVDITGDGFLGKYHL